MSVEIIGESGVTYNHDIEGMVRRIHRFVKELTFSQSSSTSDMIAYDQTRLKTYFDAADSYFKWVTSQPQLDLPETHPQKYVLPSLPPLPEGGLENDDVIDLVNMFTKMRDELVNSQSSRHGSGLIVHDRARFTSILAKMRSFLDDYITDTSPLDMPESSPRAPISGSGSTGV